MKDAAGGIIYIGKAKSLRKRLASYFSRGITGKTMVLMSRVEDIELRLTQTESLALLLEAALIHQHKPKYNVSLRDDKSFPMVKITNEEFPQICITRKKEDDGARYFGPYLSGILLKDALRIIRRYFPYRSCKQLPKKACIYYRIGLSPAPCIGKIDKKGYARIIEKIALILDGQTDTLIKKLTQEMEASSKARDFEEAAKIRDQIYALSAIGETRSGFSRVREAEELKDLLKLDKVPERIEAFDISNIFGKEATGSMVSFYKGVPDKDNYRRFRIKSVGGVDDYAMLREVILRRYQRVKEENLPLPDLVLIDGGRGHLSAAEEKIRELGLPLALASLAKDKEHVYTAGRAIPLKFTSDTPALNLLRRIRDEAHRFAVSYHHLLRRKRIIGK
jgi:excinuclease ABC subunit C